MKRLSHTDSSWQGLQDNWSKICHDRDEDFETFNRGTLSLLAELVAECGEDGKDGVFARISEDGHYEAVCFVNRAFLPKYTGRVMRVRHLIMSPLYDLETFEPEKYAEVLTNIFVDVVNLDDSKYPCGHVKFHFRSPADLEVFKTFSNFLKEDPYFSVVQMAGAWLSLSKNQPNITPLSAAS